MTEYTRGGGRVFVGQEYTEVGFLGAIEDGRPFRILSRVRNMDPRYEQTVRELIRDAKARADGVRDAKTIQQTREGRMGLLLESEGVPPDAEAPARG